MKRHRLQKRYGHTRGVERAYTAEIRWAGHSTLYEVVRAKTETGANKAAMHAGMRAAAKTGRGKPDLIIVHPDGGSMAEHWKRLKGGA
jgi:hypothetical protein